jgi:uracil-DNA glycosylase
VLDEALAAAGIDRDDVYVTNAVKHFKWEPRGKRRLHQKPNWNEIRICNTWLKSELEVIDPDVVVALGATAAQAMMGREFRITKARGEVITSSPWAPFWMATLHPSAVLRIPDKEERALARADLAADLAKVAGLLRSVRVGKPAAKVAAGGRR